MARKPKGIKGKAIPRSITASLAGIRAGGALAVDGALKSMFGQDRPDSEFARKEARRFVKKLGKLKGTYVKIGQMMSMFGEHILPPVLAEALRGLADNTRPLPWEFIQPVLRRELGHKLVELEIEQQPVAAASLAQVHRAKIIATGEEICLKVQYPGLADVIDEDFNNVVRMLRLARWVKAGRDLDNWLESMREYLHHEIDYQREARFCRQIGEYVAGLDDSHSVLHVPKVYDLYSKGAVLALEYVSGKSVTDPSVARLSQARRTALGRAMLELFFLELFDLGSMQGDPNFGNYLIRPAQRGSEACDQLVLLDFGSMLDCSDEFLLHLRGAIAAGFEDDLQALVEALIGLGCLTRSSSIQTTELMVEFCRHLLEPLAPPENLPLQALNSSGEYRWSQSGLMQRAGKKAAENLVSRHFEVPSREFAIIARKLSGVFSFIAVLEAEFNGHERVAEYIHQWREHQWRERTSE